jgi:5-methyltetrahydrofolate--homocysteine methyltransferase
MSLLQQIKEVVIMGHINAQSRYPTELEGKPGVEELVRQAVEQKLDLAVVLHQGLIAGMDVVGEKFSKGEYFVPEMLFSAKAMKAGLAILSPHLINTEDLTVGKVILGTVQGDMHDIGKNLVGMMLEGAGFEVIDLGINTPPEKFLQAAQKHPEAVVGMSALLTITMGKMKDVIELLKSKGIKNKVIIGGAPVTQNFAAQIGAQGYAPDASQAVIKTKELLGIVK